MLRCNLVSLCLAYQARFCAGLSRVMVSFLVTAAHLAIAGAESNEWANLFSQGKQNRSCKLFSI